MRLIECGSIVEGAQRAFFLPILIRRRPETKVRAPSWPRVSCPWRRRFSRGGGYRRRRHVRAVPRSVVAAAAPVSSRWCHPGFASFGVAVLFENRLANSWRSGSTWASACSQGAPTVATAGPRQYVDPSGTVPSPFATSLPPDAWLSHV